MSALQTNGVRTGPMPAISTPTYERTERSSERADNSSTGFGWIVFATVMFGLAACLNVIWGIAAISSSHFFVAHTHYIISNLNTWGWITLIWGAVEVLAAASIWRGGGFGRWFGMIVAGLGALLAMLTIPAYPVWGLVLVALAVLVVYGLAAHGGRPELTR